LAGRYAGPVPTPAARIIAPIAAWIVAIAIAAAAWGGAWLAAARAGVQPETDFTRFNRGRIEAFAAHASAAGTRRVVLLGSSALKYATRDEGAFAADVAHEAGVPVATLRVASNWGTFYDFAPLAADLLRAKPDLVVMESEFLAADRPPGRRFVLWLHHLRGRLGLDAEDDAPVTSEPEVQFGHPCWHRKASRNHDMLVAQRVNWVAVRPDGPGPRAAREFTRRLLDAGADVAFVTVPRRPDYEPEAGATRVAAARDPGWQALAPRVGHWAPGPLPAEFYCDLTHVKPAGQSRYSDWIELAVARSLASPAS
jgi:hypothetical protein